MEKIKMLFDVGNKLEEEERVRKGLLDDGELRVLVQ
jgi:hypothetical protein